MLDMLDPSTQASAAMERIQGHSEGVNNPMPHPTDFPPSLLQRQHCQGQAELQERRKMHMSWPNISWQLTKYMGDCRMTAMHSNGEQGS